MTPYITIKGRKGVDAVAFYAKAFGAQEVFRNLVEDGRIMHCHLRINGSPLMLSDDYPDWRGGQEGPDPGGYTLHLAVDDADAWWKRAVDAGCTVNMPLDNQFWGDRYGQLKDPFGVSWSIGGPQT
jgi:PhnB protein